MQAKGRPPIQNHTSVIIHKIFETNSSIYAKKGTTGEV